MTSTQHPRPQTLVRYWAGDLNPGAALTISAHLDACQACQAVLDAPAPLSDGHGALPAVAPDKSPVASALGRLPGARLGRWRWAGPGLKLAHVHGAAGLGERVYVVEGRPGARLAAHGHAGAEHIAVLQGKFSEGDETFEAGGFSEHDDAACTHRLRVIGEEICICLIATEGALRLSGPARILQAWLGV